MAVPYHRPEPGDGLFLPDFCAIRMVFAVVLIAQLLAFVLVLAPLETPAELRWQDLGLVSLFVQWAALASCALLCLARPWLGRLSNTAAGVISYGLILTVVAALSEAAVWILQLPGLAPKPEWHFTFLLRNLAVAAVVAGFALRYFYVQHQWKRNLRAEAQARLQALQARIRPHFLFNSMNTIASLTRSRPEQAEAVVENLADLFRVSLREAGQHISLDEELALSRRYLAIEELRLGERLRVRWEVQDLPGDALVPPLTLQPLLENAVYHGIEPRLAGGTVQVTGTQRDGALHIAIANPLPDSARARSGGNGLALDNVRERLAGLYGPQAALEAGVEEDNFVVRLRLPYQTGDAT